MSNNDLVCLNRNQMDSLLEALYEQIKNMGILIRKKYVELLSTKDSKSLAELYMSYYAATKFKPSFVYLIKDPLTGYIKIGSSTNPWKRLKQLDSMFKALVGTKRNLSMERIIFVPLGNHLVVEHQYHKKYSKYQVYGEWFDLPNNILGEDFPEFFLESPYDDPHEGFDSRIDFIEASRYQYEVLALDIMKNDIMPHSQEVMAINAMCQVYEKIQDKNNINSNRSLLPLRFYSGDNKNLFSDETDNKTWEVFKYLYLNQNKKALATYPKFDEKTGNMLWPVLGIYNKSSKSNKKIEVMEYVNLLYRFAYPLIFDLWEDSTTQQRYITV